MIKNPQIRKPVAIASGAIIGSFARYTIGQYLLQSFNAFFPLEILIINVTGCFLMGFISTIVSRKFSTNPELFLFLTTGFLGGYTTFSAYEFDIVAQLEHLEVGGIVYWIGTPILALLSLEIGIRLSELWE